MSAVLCILALLTVTEQSAAQEPTRAVPFALVERPVDISGKIEDYKQTYKSGKLSCYNGVTRLPLEYVFDISSDGHFTVEFDLLHSVLGCARFDLEGEYYSVFLQPGKSYTVSVKAGQLKFIGDAGRPSNDVAGYRVALANDLAAERVQLESIRGGGLSATEARAGYEKYAEQRRAHLSAYAERSSLSSAARRAIELDIEFEAAHSLICYRHEVIDGRMKPRVSLPLGFLDSVYERYPVNTEGAFVSEHYIDYVANIVQILDDPQDPSVEARIAFYESQGVFTAQELKLMAGAFRGDQAVMASKEFASFDTPEIQQQEFVLRKRYRLMSLLGQVKRFTPGLGRDLIVSQGVAEQYFSGDFIALTADEWTQVENLIESEAIISILRLQAARGSGQEIEPGHGAESGVPDSSASAVADFLAASKGNVVYIDYWATWCSPCRREFTDAKRLEHEFENEDVVFLNICAKSREEDWSRMVKQKELGGEHLLLSNAEYEQLADLYGVVGFPTYVLIDREGKVSSKSAPRPSSGKEIINLIRSLLK